MDFKQFYEQWLDKNGGLNSAVKNSYDSYVSNRKDKAITTQNVTDAFIKTGSFCSFDYLDLQLLKQVMNNDTVPFFDSKPYILVLDHDKEYQYGLNLNVLPMNARYILFSNMYTLFWNDISYNIDKEYIHWREFKRINTKNIKLLLKMKSDIAINKYDVSLMRNVKVIEWQSVVPASTLYMKHSVVFNKKKNLNMQTLWKLVF